MLSKVTRGKIKAPPVLVIYGPDGCGKSTFASQAPNPIFLGTEEGTNNLDVARFPTVTSWAQVLQAVDELIKETHDFKTLAIDSLDWLEPILHQSICNEQGVKSIELASGGYGKGYLEAEKKFIEFKNKLNELRSKKGMNIILIAHAQVVSFNDPQNQMAYERFELKLHKKASALFREYVDAVLFANYETFVKKEDNKVKAYGDGARVMYTQRRPGFDAKTRFGHEFKIPLSWDAFVKGIDLGDPENIQIILERIDAIIPMLKDQSLVPKIEEAVANAYTDATKLKAIETRINTLIEGQENK